MNINRHNYESYFLPYVDNELSVQEINALNLFIEDNADLKNELEILQQSILKPEKVFYKEKESLLKNLSSSTEMEENLLLYVDNELDPAQIKTLKIAIAEDEKLATDLFYLQQTKFIPDSHVVFENKQSLYKNEKNTIIGFGWIKLAIAAIIIGFCVWGISFYTNSNSIGSNRPIIAGSSDKKDLQNNHPIKSELNSEAFPGKKLEEVKTPAAEMAQNITAPKNNSTYFEKVNNKVPGQNDLKFATQKKIATKVNNILPETLGHPQHKKIDEPYMAVIEKMGSINKNLQVSIDQSKIDGATIALKTGATNTLFIDNSVDEKEGHFTLSDNEPKRNRLSGFLRKAKRVLERTANLNNGDNNIKIANLAFTTQ